MRKPEKCKMWVGEDGDPRGMIDGLRVGSTHQTPHGVFRVVEYAPVPAKKRKRKP
jgi:hypothetical protein